MVDARIFDQTTPQLSSRQSSRPVQWADGPVVWYVSLYRPEAFQLQERTQSEGEPHHNDDRSSWLVYLGVTSMPIADRRRHTARSGGNPDVCYEIATLGTYRTGLATTAMVDCFPDVHTATTELPTAGKLSRRHALDEPALVFDCSLLAATDVWLGDIYHHRPHELATQSVHQGSTYEARDMG